MFRLVCMKEIGLSEGGEAPVFRRWCERVANKSVLRQTFERIS